MFKWLLSLGPVPDNINKVELFFWYLMEDLSWQVATFIVQKILLDDVGLDYICTTAERFFAVGRVLGNMVATLAEQPSSRLLKHIIRCYLRLSDNPRLTHLPLPQFTSCQPPVLLLLSIISIFFLPFFLCFC